MKEHWKLLKTNYSYGVANFTVGKIYIYCYKKQAMNDDLNRYRWVHPKTNVWAGWVFVRVDFNIYTKLIGL